MCRIFEASTYILLVFTFLQESLPHHYLLTRHPCKPSANQFIQFFQQSDFSKRHEPLCIYLGDLIVPNSRASVPLVQQTFFVQVAACGYEKALTFRTMLHTEISPIRIPSRSLV